MATTFDTSEARSSRWGDILRGSRKSVARTRLYSLLVVTDSLAIVGGMIAAGLFRLDDPFDEHMLTVLSVLLPLFVGLAFNGRAYNLDSLGRWHVGARRSLSALGLTASIVLGLGFALKVSSEFSRIAIFVGFAISATLLVAFRLIAKPLAKWMLPGGPIEEILLCDDATLLPGPRAKVVHAAALGLKPLMNSPHMLDRIGTALKSADRVVVVCRPETRTAWTIALKGLGINIEVLIPEVEQLGVIGTAQYGDMLTAIVARGPLGTREEVIKRSFDLLVVLAALPVLLVVSAIVAVAIKLDDGGPVLFKQSRIGQGNRLFGLYKFRSMRHDRLDATGAVSTARGDARITRVGRILRSTSLDELPQFVNVLKGDMSVVGPRPHAIASTAGEELFWDVDDRYWFRHAAKPGLTGLAQVRGFRGATSTAADLTNRVQADIEYLSGWTLRRDLRILLATMKVLLHPNAF